LISLEKYNENVFKASLLFRFTGSFYQRVYKQFLHDKFAETCFKAHSVDHAVFYKNFKIVSEVLGTFD
jgi:hypothetical protein